MPLITITLTGGHGGELAHELREVDDKESVSGAVIAWLMDESITLSVGDRIDIGDPDAAP